MKNKIKFIIKKMLLVITELLHHDNLSIGLDVTNDKLLAQVIDNTISNRSIRIAKLYCPLVCKYKWVGGVYYKDYLYGIPCGSNVILKFNTTNNEIKFLGYVGSEKFKWSGGCIYENKIYGFMRSSNKLLCIDPNSNKIDQIDLGLEYSDEHHYGGVLAKNGFIYQPPRNTDHILVTDLNSYNTYKIMLCSRKSRIKFRYCGGVLHNNGLIYFFPERGEKVLVLDPLSEKYSFIGKRINCMVFDAAIATNGNIYGFSAYDNGILEIDVRNNYADMICTEIGIPGCFGTKLGINGKLYGIPGDGNYFWEFDILTKKAVAFYNTGEVGEAKCAGGIVTKEGAIICVPAFGNYIYKIVFNDSRKIIPKQLLESVYFCDTY